MLTTKGHIEMHFNNNSRMGWEAANTYRDAIPAKYPRMVEALRVQPEHIPEGYHAIVLYNRQNQPYVRIVPGAATATGLSPL